MKAIVSQTINRFGRVDILRRRGVQVVYDGSGAVTFDDSLASLRRHGVLTYYGPVLGSPKPIDIATLRRERLSVDKSQQLIRLRAIFAIGMLP